MRTLTGVAVAAVALLLAVPAGAQDLQQKLAAAKESAAAQPAGAAVVLCGSRRPS